MTDRAQLREETYTRLFSACDTSATEQDPEFMAILRWLIFGDVFATGDLDDGSRELITVVVLTTVQTLPQLRAHTAAALNVGLSPIEVREAVYQCAPFIGFPGTLNAVGVINEVFAQQGADLPLPDQGTTGEDDRFAKGYEIYLLGYDDANSFYRAFRT